MTIRSRVAAASLEGALASDARASVVQRCPLAIPRRILSPSGVEFAAVLSRFNGAEVALVSVRRYPSLTG